jgi:hypothetical protein
MAQLSAAYVTNADIEHIIIKNKKSTQGTCACEQNIMRRDTKPL